MKCLIRFIFLFQFFVPVLLLAQQQNLSFDRDFSTIYQRDINGLDCNVHSSIKPYLAKDIQQIVKKDSSSTYKGIFYKKEKSRQKNNPSSSFLIFPLFLVQSNYNFYDASWTTEKLGGVRIASDMGRKVSFNVTCVWGNSQYINYIDTLIKTTRVIPGMGYAYASSNGYVHENYSGYLSYSPNKIFNFQLGKDKHFIGDGYRSLFLSDAANNYPFFKISTTIGKLKYVNVFASLTDVTTPSSLRRDFKNKYAAFHYLSWNVCKRLSVGFFESVLWQGSDANRVRTFDVNYLNPVIFYRPVEYSLGSSDNALLGFNGKIKISSKKQIYGQIILDEFLLKEVKAMSGWWANKQGVQIGFKNFDLFRLKNLTFQTEMNVVRPYTYSHGSVQQNYGHYNQSLAHPMGANFIESVSFLTYRYRDVVFEGKAIATVYGEDIGGKNYGKNIYLSYVFRPHDYGNTITQGMRTYLGMVDFRIAYMLIPKALLKMEAGASYRLLRNQLNTSKTPFVYFGIKTTLGNFYTDFN